MKILISFSPEIGLPQMQKDVSANESVQNLQILVSLSYQKMNEAKLVYQGRTLLNKGQLLGDIMDPNLVNEVTVSPKSQLQTYAEQMGSVTQLFQRYPIYSVGAVVGLIFLVLFIMGN